MNPTDPQQEALQLADTLKFRASYLSDDDKSLREPMARAAAILTDLANGRWVRSYSEGAFVTTTDTCSNCHSKLKNAETARLNYQVEAYKLSLQIKQLEKERDAWKCK